MATRKSLDALQESIIADNKNKMNKITEDKKILEDYLTQLNESLIDNDKEIFKKCLKQFVYHNNTGTQYNYKPDYSKEHFDEYYRKWLSSLHDNTCENPDLLREIFYNHERKIGESYFDDFFKTFDKKYNKGYLINYKLTPENCDLIVLNYDLSVVIDNLTATNDLYYRSRYGKNSVIYTLNRFKLMIQNLIKFVTDLQRLDDEYKKTSII